MNAVERRQEIVRLITTNDEAMSGSMLAKELDVSRQVISTGYSTFKRRQDMKFYLPTRDM